jgi:hypothetical protein
MEAMTKYVDVYERDFRTLCSVLVDWDFTRRTSDGEIAKTKPDEKTVKTLQVPVAEFLLSLYNEEGELSEEQEKNS